MLMRDLPRFFFRTLSPELRHAACQIPRDGHLRSLVNEQTSVVRQWHDAPRVVGVTQDDNLAAWYVEWRWIQYCSVGKGDAFSVLEDATQD